MSPFYSGARYYSYVLTYTCQSLKGVQMKIIIPVFVDNQLVRPVRPPDLALLDFFSLAQLLETYKSCKNKFLI